VVALAVFLVGESVLALKLFGSSSRPPPRPTATFQNTPRLQRFIFLNTQQAPKFKMPPKGKKGQDKGKSGEEERDEPLQAVVCSMMRLRRAPC
jgi:hypothetical protein